MAEKARNHYGVFQMKSNTTGRDPKKAFTLDAFSNYNNRMRVDLGFGAAGAYYGMQSLGKGSSELVPPILVDDAIANMLRDAKPEATLSEDAAKNVWGGTGLSGYDRWKSIFAPDSGLSTFYKQASVTNFTLPIRP